MAAETTAAFIAGDNSLTLPFNSRRSGVPIKGRGKCSRRTITIDARVNHQLYLPTLEDQGFESRVEVNAR